MHLSDTDRSRVYQVKGQHDSVGDVVLMSNEEQLKGTVSEPAEEKAADL